MIAAGQLVSKEGKFRLWPPFVNAELGLQFSPTLEATIVFCKVNLSAAFDDWTKMPPAMPDVPPFPPGEPVPPVPPAPRTLL